MDGIASAMIRSESAEEANRKINNCGLKLERKLSNCRSFLPRSRQLKRDRSHITGRSEAAARTHGDGAHKGREVSGDPLCAGCL